MDDRDAALLKVTFGPGDTLPEIPLYVLYDKEHGGSFKETVNIRADVVPGTYHVGLFVDHAKQLNIVF